MACAKKEYSSRQPNIELRSNFYPVEVSHENMVYCYSIEVSLQHAGRRPLILTKGSDARKILRYRLLHFLVLECLRQKTKFVDEFNFAFDGISMNHMYSLQKIEEICVRVPSSVLDPSRLDEAMLRTSDADDEEFQIVISPVESEHGSVCLGDFGDGSGPRALVIKKALNAIVAQPLYNTHLVCNRLAFCDGPGEAYGRGFVKRSGMDKAVRVVEGAKTDTGRHPQIALNVDAKTSMFYPSLSFYDGLSELFGRPLEQINWDDSALFHEANDYVKGVDMVHQPPADADGRLPRREVYEVKGLTRKPARECSQMIPKDGDRDNLVETCVIQMDRWRESRRSLHSAPCLLVKKGVYDCYYPLDLSLILPHQRLPLGQKFINLPCAIEPALRYRLIGERASEMDVFDSAWLRRFGVRVLERATTAAIRLPIDHISVHFAGDARARVDPTTCAWRTERQHRFVHPAKIHSLTVFVDAEGVKDMGLVKEFISILTSVGRQRGMHIATPSIETREPDQVMERLSEEWKRAGRDENRLPTFMYISGKQTDDHAYLKYCESRMHVLTQHVTLELVKEVAKKKQMVTAGNILAKLNEKQPAGHNCYVDAGPVAKSLWFNGRRMFIGLDVWHPTGDDRAKGNPLWQPSEPSTVGIAHNGGPFDQKLVGDFFYQKTRQEQIDSRRLEEKMRAILDGMEKEGRQPPEEIVVLRDGVSDGQISMVLEYEVSSMEAVAEEWADARGIPPPHFLVILCQKRHIKRFFRADHGRLENPLPCTIVDSTVVRADMTEFYMITARPLQGTAKPVEVVLLRNDRGHSIESIEAMLVAMSFIHEITGSPISGPVPIRCADEIAERGADLYKQFVKYMGMEKYRFASAESVSAAEQCVGYARGPLRRTRVNA